ncbi:MAG: hypothetical protein K5989_13000 [Lachnospiraceae bacterium]|nr:hypothetical protein [Lachnospiraceae bacterium]
MDNKSIFREKSLGRVSSPEKLNDYIKVTTPSVWLVLLAIMVLLIGAFIWSIYGTLPVHTADGGIELVQPISFILN